MNKKYVLAFLLLVFIVRVHAQETWEQPEFPTEVDWSTYPLNDMPSSYLQDNPGVAELIPESRINDFSPDVRNAYIEAKFPGVAASLGEGSVQLNGNILTLAGTTIDLSQMAGRAISVSGNDVLVDDQRLTNAQNVGAEEGRVTADSAQYFESGTTTFINAEGIKFSPNAFYVAKADSISYSGTTSTKIVEFTGESGTFSVKSADRVIVETMTFDKIVDSVFKVSNSNLMAANIECDKNNSNTKFPNLIPGTSTFVTTDCDKTEGYSVSYRENANEMVFNLSQNMSILLQGTAANITFNATANNASLIIRPDGVFAITNGILSYITGTFTEQLEGSCMDYSVADIDFSTGFLSTILFPFNDYRTGVFICPGARYSRIYPERENSYSIYNIGVMPYSIIFDKNNQLFSDAFHAYRHDSNYGFVSANITLNGNIEYDRIPEKGLFPAISAEEYSALPIEWKKVYASYDEKTGAVIDGAKKIRISSQNTGNGTNDVLIEINSGWFNIIEKQTGTGIRRYASFNKNITYPDYVEYYKFNSEPEITIKNKTLEQRGTSAGGKEKVVKMFSPGTEEETKFLDWLKVRTVLRDLSEYVGMLFG